MTKPKIPPARYSAGVVAAVAVITLTLTRYLGWQANTTVLGAGLFLDIVGAVVLAVPDVPRLHRHFFSGKVKNALDCLELERGAKESILIRPETEDRFVDALYIVEDVSGEAIWESDLLENVTQSPEPATEGFFELRKALREGTNDSLWDRVFGFKVYEKADGSLGSYIMYDNDGNPDVKVKGTFSNPFDKAKKTLRQSEARFRRMGLSLLISGFGFQGLSLAV